MLKNLTSGALINYGPDLPDPSTAYDGALFFKISGADQGMYIYGFKQDANSAVTGDQVDQGWFQVTSANLYVAKAGDTMTGDLTVQSAGGVRVANVNNLSSGSVFAPVGTSQGITISGNTGPVSFIAGNTQRMQLSVAGVLSLTTTAGTGVVWTNLNDGAGSGLDADLLDGQDSTFYQNATNLSSGTLNAARLPFMPVQQGGGGAQTTSKVYVGWGGSQLRVQVDATDFGVNWPININGNAATANAAQAAVTATNSTNAVSAQYVRANASAGGTNMYFNPAGTGGQPTWMFGSNDATGYVLYNPSNFSVNYASNSGNSASTSTVRMHGNGTPMTFRFTNPVSGNLNYFWMTNEEGNAYVIPPGQVTVNAANTAGTVGNIDAHAGTIRTWISNSMSCAQMQLLYNRMIGCGIVGTGGGTGGPIGPA